MALISYRNIERSLPPPRHRHRPRPRPVSVGRTIQRAGRGYGHVKVRAHTRNPPKLVPLRSLGRNVGRSVTGARPGYRVVAPAGDPFAMRYISLPAYRRLVASTRTGQAQRRQLARTVPTGRLQAAHPKHLSIAGIGLPIAAGTGPLQRALASTPIGSYAKGFAGIAAPGARDLVTLPGNVVTGGYLTGRALYKATPIPGVKRSDPRELKQLGHALTETDPIALAVQGRFHEAFKQAGQHPLVTGLEVYGAAGTASRLAGRIGTAGKAGALVREPRVLPGTRLAQPRTAKPGLVGRSFQGANERRRVAKSQRLARKSVAAETRGNPDLAQHFAQRAARVDPNRVPESYIAHRVDLHEGLHQSIRRPHRAIAAKAPSQAVPKRGAQVVSLIAQHIAEANPQDLRAFVSELAKEAPGLRPAKRFANYRLRQQVEKVLRDPKVNLGHLEQAAKDYAAVQKPIEEQLIAAKMLAPGEAEMAKLKGYAVRKMGARYDPEKGMVRDIRVPGKKDPIAVTLDAAAIKQHMREHGIDPSTTAFVSHSPVGSTEGAYNVSARRPQGISTRHRTGEAVRQGAIDVSRKRMVAQNVRMQGLLDAHHAYQGFIQQMGLRAQGKLVTRKTRSGETGIDNIVRDLNSKPGGHKWRAVRLTPWQGRDAQLEQVIKEADAEGYVRGGAHPVSEAVQYALSGHGDRGPWAAVPDAAASRLSEHAGVYQGGLPAVRAVTQGFRRTVLPLSTPWLTGNTLEAALRTAITGGRPKHWVAIRRTYQELARQDPAEAERLLHSIPGGHYGGSADTMIRTTARQLGDGPLGTVGRSFEHLASKPGPGTLARAYVRFSDWVFQTVNAGIEGQFTRTLAGKALMDRGVIPKQAGRIFAFTEHQKATMAKAVEQAAWGARNTNEQAAMTDFAMRAYGQYDSLSPAMRKTMLTFTPFGMWTLNAFRFLFSVLPRDHPALTGLIAANHQLTEDWRKAHGLDFYSASPVPSFLQGSIPLPGGGHLRPAKFTPFGLFAGSPVDVVASNILPQFSGFILGWRGLDWRGQPIRGANGQPENDPLKLTLLGIREFAYGTIPGIGIGGRLAQKGPEAVFNPFHVVPPRKAKGGSGSFAPHEVDQIKRASGSGAGFSSGESDQIKKAFGR